jgi:hypothetical protein
VKSKHEVQTEIEVVLTLTEAEARWLKAYMQNARGALSDEPPADSDMRMRFWKALEKVDLK